MLQELVERRQHVDRWIREVLEPLRHVAGDQAHQKLECDEAAAAAAPAGLCVEDLRKREHELRKPLNLQTYTTQIIDQLKKKNTWI